jgi:hypothetical protein
MLHVRWTTPGRALGLRARGSRRRRQCFRGEMVSMGPMVAACRPSGHRNGRPRWESNPDITGGLGPRWPTDRRRLHAASKISRSAAFLPLGKDTQVSRPAPRLTAAPARTNVPSSRRRGPQRTDDPGCSKRCCRSGAAPAHLPSAAAPTSAPARTAPRWPTSYVHRHGPGTPARGPPSFAPPSTASRRRRSGGRRGPRRIPRIMCARFEDTAPARHGQGRLKKSSPG